MSIQDDSINPGTLQARLDGEESYNWKSITSGLLENKYEEI